MRLYRLLVGVVLIGTLCLGLLYMLVGSGEKVMVQDRISADRRTYDRMIIQQELSLLYQREVQVSETNSIAARSKVGCYNTPLHCPCTHMVMPYSSKKNR